MNIDIKTAGKIAKDYKRIEQLTSEIVSLDRFANTILKTEGQTQIKLTTKKIKDVSKSDILDEDGSLKSEKSSFNLDSTRYYITFQNDDKLDNDDLNLNFKIPEYLTLEVIGTLIRVKQIEIEGLLNKFKQP